MPENMRITLTAWRQTGPDAAGAFETAKYTKGNLTLVGSVSAAQIARVSR